MQCTISLKFVSCIHVYRNWGLVVAVVLGLVMHMRPFGASVQIIV